MYIYFKEDEITDQDVEKMIWHSEQTRETYPFSIALYDNQDVPIPKDSLLINDDLGIDAAIDNNPKLWLMPTPFGEKVKNALRYHKHDFINKHKYKLLFTRV